MICFPELLQKQKHLPIGGETLNHVWSRSFAELSGRQTIPHTESRQTEEGVKVCLILADFGTLTELS